MPGADALSGLLLGSGIPAYAFEWRAGEPLMDGLRTILHRVRRECGAASVLARGTGCGAALALAEQLPVERLALIEPAEALVHNLNRLWRSDRRASTVRRVGAFARRNLSLCVADALVIEGEQSEGWRLLHDGGMAAHSRLIRLAIPADTVDNLYTNCENALKRPVTGFLTAGELPKDLAENREMCIIYG